jgi:hypothetical protein
VLLDVPVLKVEGNLTVEGLRALVAVLAELADLVKLSVGADVGLDKVELEIKGVEAGALEGEIRAGPHHLEQSLHHHRREPGDLAELG